MNNSEEQRKIILEGNIPSVVMKMAIPSIVIQIISLIYNTVDTYFISQIDKSAAAAVGAVFSIQSIIQAVGFGFGMGVSSLCSRKLGEGEDEEANVYANSGIVGAALLATLIGVLGMLFLNPLLNLIGCTDTMLTYGRDYAKVILIFAPLSCILYVVGNIFKAEGHLKFSMYGNVFGAILNAVLDPILIFNFEWGAMGAAVSTTISQAVSLIIYSIPFIKGQTVIRINPRYIGRRFSIYLQVFTTGIPTIFRQGLGSLATALLCKQASNFGDAAVAAVTIANKCYMLTRNVILGLGQGTQPVAGYNYGAKLYKRTNAAFGFAIRVGTVVCVISAVVLYIFSSQVMWWFCKDTEVLEYGVPALHFASLVMPVMAFSTYVSQEYQCLGFKKQASFLASSRQGICFIPIILVLPYFFGVAGVEIAQPLADLLTFIISIPFFISMTRRLTKEPKEVQQE